MKAIQVTEIGGPEVLQLREAETPEPGRGEARIKVSAAGLNFIDVYHRTGLYPLPLPFIPGREAGGVVDAVAPDVSEVQVGDRAAFAMQPATYAEYVVVPAGKLVPVPDEVDMHTAAAVILQGMTAHYLVHDTYPIRPGDTALVHAAAGGVGRLLVQMAKMRGARVIATVSTVEKAELARSAGADEIILYTQMDFEAETMRLTNQKGVNVVFDSVGRTTFLKGLNVLKPRGMMVLYGNASGPVEPVDPLLLNSKGSLYLTRPTLGHYMADRTELMQRATDIFGWISAGELEVRIDRTFPLAEAPAAHRYLEERQTKGKVLLIT